ncbi:MAG: helix-turn-helix transcriptional regulator [Oscillospiraceae bacterium]|nr:helix-turn-helix transcriptional regulator [Oscillospiraceae bacterium]
MDKSKTGALIAELRKEKGFTQKQLAELLHVSDRTVSKWERGAGFPDVGLLEALADTLGLSVVELISGERSELPTEKNVRRAISSIGEHVKHRLWMRIGQVLGGIVIAIMFCYVMFAILDHSGAFREEIYLEIPAGVYIDGVRTEDTSVIIDGSVSRLKDKNFWGRFAVEAIEKTTRDYVKAAVYRNAYGDGLHGLEYYVTGELWIENSKAVPESSIYISEDMTAFAFQLADGRIIATSDALAALRQLGWNYPLDF